MTIMNTLQAPEQATLFGNLLPTRPLKLRELPRHEQPQGRLCEYGADTMSDAELLALVLGAGTKQLDALQFAQRLLLDADGWHGLLRSSVAELQHTYGLTEAKAARIKAALAIGQRMLKQQPQRVQMTQPEDIATLLMAEMSYLDQEQLRAVLLSTKNHVLRIVTVDTKPQHMSRIPALRRVSPAFGDRNKLQSIFLTPTLYN